MSAVPAVTPSQLPESAPRRAERRMPLIDAFKAIASQLIVLHHLSSYGPLSESARELAPQLLDWMYDYARVAVQVFLVIGGFLAAKGLAPTGEPTVERPLLLIWKRYRRLVLPYLAALGVGITCAALARLWLWDGWVPNAPTLPQLAAHALLLNGLLNQEALSAGVWYVAIDFQLFALMVLTLWLSRKAGAVAGQVRRLTPVLVGVLAVVSLFHFNRNEVWDEWAIYFFGSYAMGALAYWAADERRSYVWLTLLAAIVVAALAVDFRLRIAVALAVALALGVGRRTGALEAWLDVKPLAYLGKISYSVFLFHFPVLMVMNAVIPHLAPRNPTASAIGLMLAWAISVAVGAFFFRLVESRVR